VKRITAPTDASPGGASMKRTTISTADHFSQGQSTTRRTCDKGHPPDEEGTVNTPTRPTAAETQLHSEGAEFLVVGQLLIRGVHATKAYTRYPGWDVLAANPATGRSCRIQVKARLATDFDGGFPIKNFDADFVVLVALNRGYRYGMAKRRTHDSADTGEREPEFFVLPMDVVRKVCETAPRWGNSWKVYVRRAITEWERYRNAWDLIVAAVS
jgi:hypothetical protein